jgi:hypothetical protein
LFFWSLLNIAARMTLLKCKLNHVIAFLKLSKSQSLIVSIGLYLTWFPLSISSSHAPLGDFLDIFLPQAFTLALPSQDACSLDMHVLNP